jgi:hypothetical protein
MRLPLSRRVVLLTVALALAVGCAARGPRAHAQVGALALTDLAVDLSQAEQTLYAASVPGYTKADHDAVGRRILQVLYATRGYERAAAAWPAGAPKPENVTQAGLAISLALDDLAHVIPAIAGVRDQLNRAITALRAALASLQVDGRHDAPIQAQLPGGGLIGLLALVQVLAKLLSEGKTTVADFRGWLEKEGATPADFVAADAAISSEIAVREQEHPPQ